MEENRPKRETVVRTAALFVVLINQVIVLLGGSALPFTDEQIYEAASTAATVIASLWAWWRNNSFTDGAIEADLFLDMLKSEKKSR